MEFNDAQRAALSHKEGPMMVLAGPGSGKTTVITHRIQRLLEQGVSPSGILVITFTKAAAAEMKERFLKLADQAGMDREIGKRVSFGTFHSVFYQILRLAYRFPPGNVIGEEEKRAYLKTLIDGTELASEDQGELISSLLNDPFWDKAERLLLVSLIAYLHYEAPVEEQNFATLLEMLNTMQVSEDDETYQNPVDLLFEDLGKKKPKSFAVRQYKLYKLAAGDICSK